MAMLLVGLLIFAGVHFVPSLAPGVKSAWLGRLGENGYKGTFSLLLLAGLALIILGWRSAVPEFVYRPPAGMHYPALVLMFIGFLLFIVSNRQSSLRRLIRHPQLTGVILWGIAHLLLNGDNRSLLLFGGLTLWAALEILMINRREGPWTKPEAPAMGTEAVTVVITAVVFGVVIAIHPWLSGRAVW